MSPRRVPRARAKSSVRFKETPPQTSQPPGISCEIRVDVDYVGDFRLAFSATQVTGKAREKLSSIPLVPLSVLSVQLLLVHNEFWMRDGLPVNPVWNQSRTVVTIGGAAAALRKEYATRLVDLFNAECVRQRRKDTMIYVPPPQN